MISLLCPTRNRPDNVRRMYRSALENAAGPVEALFYVDEDAPKSVPGEELRELGHELTGTVPSVCVVPGPRITLSDMWNVLARSANGEIMMHCGDDIVFRSKDWDLQVINTFNAYPDRIVFVHGNAMDYGERFGTHGFLHRRWVQTVGYFTPPYFASDYADTWINDVADMIGRRHYLPDVITEHMHFVFGKAPLDATYQERLDRHGNAVQLYESTLDQRQEAAEKLRAAMW